MYGIIPTGDFACTSSKRELSTVIGVRGGSSLFPSQWSVKVFLTVFWRIFGAKVLTQMDVSPVESDFLSRLPLFESIFVLFLVCTKIHD